jgi:hypothetical protein
MKLNKRETEIVRCALSDYHYQFINDTSNQDFLTEIVTLLKKIENENKNTISGI